MKLQFTTYFEDGSSRMTEIEKPADAHPDSIAVIAEGLLEAEKTGKRVSRIGMLKVNPFSSPKTALVIDDNLFTREDVLRILRMAMSPMKKGYESLFL